MKFLLIAISMSLCSTVYAGKDEYNREVEKAQVEYRYAVKTCKAQKTEPVKVCIKRVKGYLKDATKGLKNFHLDKGQS